MQTKHPTHGKSLLRNEFKEDYQKLKPLYKIGCDLYRRLFIEELN